MRHEKFLDLIALACELAANAEGLSLDEIAIFAKVDRRTAERMRDVLRQAFPGFEERREGRGKRFHIAAGLSGFMKTPNATELAELDLAAATLERDGAADRATALRSLSAKMRAGLRAADKVRLDPDFEALRRAEVAVMQVGPRPLENPQTLAMIRYAILSGCHCLFDYPQPNRAAIRERAVRPFGVLFGRSYYLVGAQARMREPAMWRLDRMSNVRMGDPSPPPPKDFSLANYAARSFGVFQEDAIDVALRFSPEAAPEARRFLFHPTQRFEDASDGALIVRFRSGGRVELVRHLFTWGDQVTILSPTSLRKLMRDTLRAALTQHGGRI